MEKLMQLETKAEQIGDRDEVWNTGEQKQILRKKVKPVED